MLDVASTHELSHTLEDPALRETLGIWKSEAVVELVQLHHYGTHLKYTIATSWNIFGIWKSNRSRCHSLICYAAHPCCRILDWLALLFSTKSSSFSPSSSSPPSSSSSSLPSSLSPQSSLTHQLALLSSIDSPKQKAVQISSGNLLVMRLTFSNLQLSFLFSVEENPRNFFIVTQALHQQWVRPNHTCKKRGIAGIYPRNFFWIFRKILG